MDVLVGGNLNNWPMSDYFTCLLSTAEITLTWIKMCVNRVVLTTIDNTLEINLLC